MKTREELEKEIGGQIGLAAVTILWHEISERDTLIKSYDDQAIRSIKNNDELIDIISERDKALEAETLRYFERDRDNAESKLLNQIKDVEFNELKKLLEDYRKENALNVISQKELKDALEERDRIIYTKDLRFTTTAKNLIISNEEITDLQSKLSAMEKRNAELEMKEANKACRDLKDFKNEINRAD